MVDLARPQPGVRLPACYLLFTNPGSRGGRYRTVPERYRTVTDFDLTPSQWDSLQIPVAVAFFFDNSALGTTAAFFPSPAGATECLLPLDTWREVEAANPILDSLEPDVEAALIRTDGDARRGGVLHRAHRLLLRAGRPAATLWRGFDGGREVHEAMAGYFDRLRAGEAGQAAGSRWLISAPRSSTCASSRTRRFPPSCASLRLREATGIRVHTVALHTQVRIEPQRRRYNEPEQDRLLELFGRPPQWGDSLRPFLWTHMDAMVSGFDNETLVDLPMACTYDFDVAGSKYLHSLESGEVPLVFLFSGTVFTKGEPASPPSWSPGTSRASTGCPSRSGADDGPYFPGGGWLRLDRGTIDRLQRYRAEQALPTWEQAIVALLKAAGEDRDPRRRNPGRTVHDRPRPPLGRSQGRSRRICYEGYVLYPYRASATKNQLRWQFGVLAPPSAAAGGSDPSAARTEFIVETRPGARLHVRLRGLQVQQRSVEARRNDGFVPVAQLDDGEQVWTSFDEAVDHQADLVDIDLEAACPVRVRPHRQLARKPRRGVHNRGRRFHRGSGGPRSGGRSSPTYGCTPLPGRPLPAHPGHHRRGQRDGLVRRFGQPRRCPPAFPGCRPRARGRRPVPVHLLARPTSVRVERRGRLH